MTTPKRQARRQGARLTERQLMMLLRQAEQGRAGARPLRGDQTSQLGDNDDISGCSESSHNTAKKRAKLVDILQEALDISTKFNHLASRSNSTSDSEEGNRRSPCPPNNDDSDAPTASA